MISDSPQILIGKLGGNTGMFIVWFKNSFWLSWRLGGTRLQEKLDSTTNVKIIFLKTHLTLLSPFSKFNLKFDRVNIVAPASPIECLLYLPNVRAIKYRNLLKPHVSFHNLGSPRKPNSYNRLAEITFQEIILGLIPR